MVDMMASQVKEREKYNCKYFVLEKIMLKLVMINLEGGVFHGF